ncbi:peptidylprolyl isomerase [uncultured Ruminococcus sp.]|uniref:peptidylprolyl isomerase n=1 Tax=uncultured Ruminococcus sp. TaxID=165186 RepID=UPI0025F8C0DA|nr:peptidylprolyl isomerase [uncultured Ruminococcus sp.]
MKETNYIDRNKGKRFRTYFQFSMIAVCFVLVFALFYACQGRSNSAKLNSEDVKVIQYDLPSDDAAVAVFETSKGTFKAVIYEDEAPKTAKYFRELVDSGYYDGTYVFAVQDGVYFMGGSKSENGTDTDDTNKETIDPEITPDLWPFRGALISYGDKGGTVFNQKVMSGSRMLFVDTVEFTDEFVEELDSAGGNDELVETFKEKGGIPNFAQQYTIFGQIYDGYDVYDEICSADVVNSENLTPKSKITFDKVYMSTYGENRNDEFFTASVVPAESAVDTDTESSQEN